MLAGLPRQGAAGAAGRAEAARPAQHRTAHEGAVTAVVPTPDGLQCLTAGTDSRLRLWDLHTHRWAPLSSCWRCPPHQRYQNPAIVRPIGVYK